MASEIKTKLTLEGEQQYKKSLDEAYSSLRVLRAELKAETAEMGRNASAQEKARAKADSLRKQIAEQEKIVAALNAAFKQAQEQYSDNAEVQDKWQAKLANARTVLANMKNQLDSTNDSIEAFNDVVKDVDSDTGRAENGIIVLGNAMDSMKSIADGLADAVSGAFTATLNSVKAVWEEIQDLMVTAMASVEDWKAISDVYGGSDVGIERFFLSVKGTGNIASTLNQLVNRTDNGNADVATALTMLGDAESNYTNHWDYYIGVLSKLAGVSDSKQQTEIAELLFGKGSWSSVQAMMTHWGDINDYATKLDDNNALIDQQSIDIVDQAALGLERLQTTFDQVKSIIGAKIIVTIGYEQIESDALDTLLDIAAFFNAGTDEERSQALIKLSADVNILATDINDAITKLTTLSSSLATSLSESNDPILSAIGDIWLEINETVKDIADWVKEIWPLVKPYLSDIIKAWALNKGVEAVTGQTPGEWLNTIFKGVMDFSIVKKLFGGGGAAAGAAETAAATGLPLLLQNLGGSLSTAFSGFMGTVASMDPTGMFGMWFNDNVIQPALSGTLDEKLSETAESVSESVDATLGSYERVVGAWADWRHNNLAVPIDSALEWIASNFSGDGKPAYVDTYQYYDDEFGYNNEGFGLALADAVKLGLIDQQEAEAHGLVTAYEAEMSTTLSKVESKINAMFDRESGSFATALSGVQVIMDGETVGRLVAPTVDRYLFSVSQ